MRCTRCAVQDCKHARLLHYRLLYIVLVPGSTYSRLDFTTVMHIVSSYMCKLNSEPGVLVLSSHNYNSALLYPRAQQQYSYLHATDLFLLAHT